MFQGSFKALLQFNLSSVPLEDLYHIKRGLTDNILLRNIWISFKESPFLGAGFACSKVVKALLQFNLSCQSFHVSGQLDHTNGGEDISIGKKIIS